MKTIKPGTEVRVTITYANPTRTRVKHGIVTAVEDQDHLTARVGRTYYAIEPGAKFFDDHTIYATATGATVSTATTGAAGA